MNVIDQLLRVQVLEVHALIQSEKQKAGREIWKVMDLTVE